MIYGKDHETSREDKTFEQLYDYAFTVCCRSLLTLLNGVKGDDGSEDIENSWRGYHHCYNGSNQIEEGCQELPHLKFSEFFDKQFRTYFFLAYLQLCRVGSSTDLAFRDFYNLRSLHFFGNPVEDTILMNICNATWTLTESYEWSAFIITNPASMFFSLRVFSYDFIGKTGQEVHRGLHFVWVNYIANSLLK